MSATREPWCLLLVQNCDDPAKRMSTLPLSCNVCVYSTPSCLAANTSGYRMLAPIPCQIHMLYGLSKPPRDRPDALQRPDLGVEIGCMGARKPEIKAMETTPKEATSRMDLGRKMSRKAFMESNHSANLDPKRLSKATGTIFTALRCRNDAPGPSDAGQRPVKGRQRSSAPCPARFLSSI